ncbi:MAG TPA: response regulator [Bacteriovoracaceae bacterium]|nr:response regulator [Bacteriovoracaceae bacterium]
MSKRFKVLIVDDSSFSRTHLSKLVNETGHTVAGEAASAQEALSFINEHPVDVVITDIVMPEITGIQLTETITKKHNNIYVIVVSSLSQEHVILDAITAGATDFIPKPVTLEQMNDSLIKINKLINEH